MHFLQNYFYVLNNSPFLSKSNLGNIYSNLLQFALRLWQPLLNFSRSLLCGFNGRFGTVRHVPPAFLPASDYKDYPTSLQNAPKYII